MATAHAATIAALGNLIAGIQKHPPSGALVIDGTSYTTKQIVALLQSVIESLNAAVAARATFLEASKTSEASVSDNSAFVRDLKQSLKITYGSQGSILADFGLTPRKLRTTSPAVAIAAAAKAAATRLARGTKGKKQKAQISGNVTSVTITPVTTPTPAPAATAAAPSPVIPVIPATSGVVATAATHP